MRKLLLTICLLSGGCFAQIDELEQELKDTRLLAALGLLEAQNKGAGSGSGAVAVIDNGDQTVRIPAYNLSITKCGVGLSGNYCETGGSNATFCNANNNTCNGGMDTGTLDGGGTSTAYTTCDSLVLGGHSDWRLPTLNEAEKLAVVKFASLHVSSPSGWTSQSLSATLAARFDSGIDLVSGTAKTGNLAVYCVR